MSGLELVDLRLGLLVVVDDFALYFKLIVAGSAFFAVLAASRWSGQTGDAPE